MSELASEILRALPRMYRENKAASVGIFIEAFLNQYVSLQADADDIDFAFRVVRDLGYIILSRHTFNLTEKGIAYCLRKEMADHPEVFVLPDGTRYIRVSVEGNVGTLNIVTGDMRVENTRVVQNFISELAASSRVDTKTKETIKDVLTEITKHVSTELLQSLISLLYKFI